MRTINLIQNLSNKEQILQQKVVNINEEMLTDPQYLELASMLAEEYSNENTYIQNEFCKYNNKIYVSNTAILIPEEFNSNHWDLIG